jgi:hypothetical protein
MLQEHKVISYLKNRNNLPSLEEMESNENNLKCEPGYIRDRLRTKCVKVPQSFLKNIEFVDYCYKPENNNQVSCECKDYYAMNYSERSCELPNCKDFSKVLDCKYCFFTPHEIKINSDGNCPLYSKYNTTF